jgi:hypothetical protein
MPPPCPCLPSFVLPLAATPLRGAPRPQITHTEDGQHENGDDDPSMEASVEHFYVGGFGSEAHAFRSITSLAKTKPKSVPEELWAKRVKGHKLRSDRHTYENDTVVVPFKKGLFTPAGRACRSSKIIEVQKNGAIESGTHGGPPPPPPPSPARTHPHKP